MSADTTVSDLQAFITRAKQALTEARRPDLAERAVVYVQEDGTISLAFPEHRYVDENHEHAGDVLQFLRIDTHFEYAGASVRAGTPPATENENQQGD